MKRFSLISVLTVILWIVLFAAMLMFATGCAPGQGQPQIQIDPESQIVIGKITGRHAGNELAKRYPDIAKEVIPICNDLLEKDNLDVVVALARSIVTALTNSQINDTLLKADIKDILGMINIQSGVIATKKQIAVIKAVAEGLKSGIELYGGV